MKAFEAIETFAGRSTLSTWLTRIVVNEALGRRRHVQRRRESVLILEEYREKLMAGLHNTLPRTGCDATPGFQTLGDGNRSTTGHF